MLFLHQDTTVDPREKLCTFICKFPPERLSEVREGEAAKGGRKARRKGGQSAEGGVDFEFEQQEEREELVPCSLSSVILLEGSVFLSTFSQ